jgi:hypothetical protein
MRRSPAEMIQMKGGFSKASAPNVGPLKLCFFRICTHVCFILFCQRARMHMSRDNTDPVEHKEEEDRKEDRKATGWTQ